MFSMFRNTALATIAVGLGLIATGGAKAAPSLVRRYRAPEGPVTRREP